MKRSDPHQQHNARQYINGRWETGATTGVRRNPSDTSEVVAEYARADRRQAERAVRAAADAFAAWNHSSAQRRADALDAIGSEILLRQNELGLLVAREQGQPLADAVAEAQRAGQLFKYFAGEALRAQGETLASVRPGVQVDVTREPVGVVALMTPWRSPLALPARKIAAALAYGNSVVFKPSERVPACGWVLAEIISRAALPAGAFNLLMGSGRELGAALVDGGQVDAIAFTGSAAVGARIAQSAAKRRARVQLDMGGSNALVVMADSDVERAVECAVQGAYSCSGQRCTATSRIIVEAPVHATFVARLRQRLTTLRVGHALEKGVVMGPLIDAEQLARNLDAVRAAREEGAELVHGGEALERPSQGHYMSPALLLALPGNKVVHEALLGPVACVLEAMDYDHALALANDCTDGLCAGICTRSLAYATHFRRHARVGTTLINLPTTAQDYHVPHGGRKSCGDGPRAQGRQAAEFFTTLKTSYLQT